MNEGQEGKRKECPISHNFREKGGEKEGAGHISHNFDAANGCCLHEIG